MLLGVGKTIITPPLGTPLAGYGHREQGATAILDELEARVFWFRDESVNESTSDTPKEACIVTADIIGFGKKLTDDLRAEFEQKFGLPGDALLLAASHTHSGPQTIENLPSAGGLPVPAYLEELRRRLVEAAATARENLAPVTLHIGRGKLEGYAINRRRMENGEMLMAPNPDGVRDDEVTVIACREANSDAVRAVLFHFTCHTTMLGGFDISGDYAGAARRAVEARMAGTAAGFLPGCFGDVRPNGVTIGGTRFRGVSPEEVTMFGDALGAEVETATEAALQTAPLHGTIQSQATTVEMPLQKEPETITLTMQRLDLADELSLIAMGGEMGVDYGHFIKKFDPHKNNIPLGYSNGLISYVAPAYQFAEGGYEPDQFYPGFSLPSPLKPEVEEIVHASLRKIMA